MAGMGFFQHFIFLVGKIVPAFLRLHINFRKFPLTQWIRFSAFKPTRLFFFGHAEIKLYQYGALTNQVFFKASHASHEIFIFFFAAEAKYRFDYGTVVPTAVKQHYFTTTG